MRASMSTGFKGQRGGQDCSKAYRPCWSSPKKSMNSPGTIHPVEPGSEPMDGTRHSSFRRKGHVRMAETFRNLSINRFPCLPCRNASVSASMSMAFGRIDGSPGTRDKKGDAKRSFRVVTIVVYVFSPAYSRRRPRPGTRTERPEAFTTI